MQVVRVFNNNSVVVKRTKNSKMTEAVVVGPGIGFKKKKGDKINQNKVEKIYYIESDLQDRLLKVLNTSKKEYLEIAEIIMKKAEALACKITTTSILSLTEHISFAIERFKSGIKLPNLLINEIQSFYKDEFEIGRWAVKYIEERISIDLGEDEAGYIALHIINTTSKGNNTSDTVDLLRFVSGVVELIDTHYKVKTSNQSFNKNRLVTHLKFLGNRIFLTNEITENDGTIDLYNYLTTSNIKHQSFAYEVTRYVDDNFNIKIEKNEIVYLLIHINKFLNNKGE